MSKFVRPAAEGADPFGTARLRRGVLDARATIHVRDSKYRDTSPRLALAPQAWTAFVAYTAEG